MRNLRNLPKADLHLHLEGSARRDTLLEIAMMDGISTDVIQAWGQPRYRDINDFIAQYLALDSLFTRPEHLRRLAVELCEDLAADGVSYAEVTVTLPGRARQMQDWDLPMVSILDGIVEGHRRFDIECTLVLDVLRGCPLEEAEKVIEVAVRYKDQGVVGLGLSGTESIPLTSQMKKLLEQGAAEGLSFVPHAGETGLAPPIWEVLSIAGIRRIGHGLGILADPLLMTKVKERSIILEICLTSNIATRVVRSLGEHPLPEFMRAGISLTLGSDDRGAFGTTLTDEYILARDVFGLADREIASLARMGVMASRASELTKQHMLKGINEWLEQS